MPPLNPLPDDTPQALDYQSPSPRRRHNTPGAFARRAAGGFFLTIFSLAAGYVLFRASHNGWLFFVPLELLFCLLLVRTIIRGEFGFLTGMVLSFSCLFVGVVLLIMYTCKVV